MIRVTRKEVKQALTENYSTKEYCMCMECSYAFKITPIERRNYTVLVCAHCGSASFFYAGCIGADSIIDPESEAMRKFGKEVWFKSGDICKVCGECWGDHHDMECPKPPINTKPYCCFVEGMNTPRVEHCTLDEAESEADRLARLPECIGHKVHVMKVINTRTSKVTIERE